MRLSFTNISLVFIFFCAVINVLQMKIHKPIISSSNGNPIINHSIQWCNVNTASGNLGKMSVTIFGQWGHLGSLDITYQPIYSPFAIICYNIIFVSSNCQARYLIDVFYFVLREKIRRLHLLRRHVLKEATELEFNLDERARHVKESISVVCLTSVLYKKNYFSSARVEPKMMWSPIWIILTWQNTLYGFFSTI